MQQTQFQSKDKIQRFGWKGKMQQIWHLTQWLPCHKSWGGGGMVQTRSWYENPGQRYEKVQPSSNFTFSYLSPLFYNLLVFISFLSFVCLFCFSLHAHFLVCCPALLFVTRSVSQKVGSVSQSVIDSFGDSYRIYRAWERIICLFLIVGLLLLLFVFYCKLVIAIVICLFVDCKLVIAIVICLFVVRFPIVCCLSDFPFHLSCAKSPGCWKTWLRAKARLTKLNVETCSETGCWQMLNNFLTENRMLKIF